MAEEQKPVRRIVSWGEYLNIWMGKIVISSILGIGFVFLIGVFCLFILGVISALPTPVSGHGGFQLALVVPCLGVFGLMGAVFIVRLGISSIKVIVQEDEGIPLALAKPTDLPPTDSLVRPSTEPLEPQQSVLLRAASDRDTTPAEQLVRPVWGNGEWNSYDHQTKQADLRAELEEDLGR